jgi:hypothetical protein
MVCTRRTLQCRISDVQCSTGLSGQGVKPHTFNGDPDRQTALVGQVLQPLLRTPHRALLDVARDLAKPYLRRILAITCSRQEVCCSRLVVLPTASMQGPSRAHRES